MVQAISGFGFGMFTVFRNLRLVPAKLRTVEAGEEGKTISAALCNLEPKWQGARLSNAHEFARPTTHDAVAQLNKRTGAASGYKPVRTQRHS